MSPILAGVLFFLTVFLAGLIALYVATRPEVDPPPGVAITHYPELGWNYIFEDQKGMIGTGYLTKRAAIRAAKAEYERRAVDE